MRNKGFRLLILMILNLSLIQACATPLVEVSSTTIVPTLTTIPPIHADVTQTGLATPTRTSTPLPVVGQADIIFYHGNIITIEKNRPVTEAIAIRGNLILAVGSNEEILMYQGPQTVMVDLQGNTIMPGIIDGHSHYVRRASEGGVPLDQIMDNLLRYGLTGDTEMHSSDDFIQTMLSAERNGEMDIRLNIFGGYNCGFLVDGSPAECTSWYKDNPTILDPARMVRVPGVKIFVDGAGSPERGCPYYSFLWAPTVTDVWPDISESCKNPYGDPYLDEAQLTRVIRDIQDRGYRASFHAMGDAAIEMILNALQTVLNGESDTVYRHQILHNSVLSPAMPERYVQMGILAQIGGMFNYSEADFYEAVFGEEHVAWNVTRYTLPNLGIHVFFGQDFNNRGDVSTLNPFPDLYGLVTQNELLSDGSVATPAEWAPESGISRERALEMLTIEPAYAVSLDEYTGSLKPGKYADLIIISGDPLSIKADDLYKIKVWMTMVNGKVKFCASSYERFCPVAVQETTPTSTETMEATPQTAPPTSTATMEAALQTAQVKYNCDARSPGALRLSSQKFLLTNIEWQAATIGQVNDFLEAVQNSIYINDKLVQSSMDHDAIQPLNQNNMATVLAYFDVGKLNPGQYEIRTVLTFSKQIYDGSVYYGLGTQNSTIQGTCTVIIE